ncbi:MAG TPA: sulfite exporter TauE/SafE family protein [Vicinamibacterales bacterium]|nr:sulfite exporter TauE/SafE family protein [Vicinamibacterales bacterium]
MLESALITILAGVGAGSLGALLGLGGGVFLVPMLDILVGLPFRTAAGISLLTVIATSSFVSLDNNSRRYVNTRLAMLLLTHTVLGASLGRLLVAPGPDGRPLLSDVVSGRIFGVTALVVALVMLHRLRRRNIIRDPLASVGVLGSRIHDPDSGGAVGYRVSRLPLALGLALVAGAISTVVGVGGGILLVPALNSWCGVPMRAAAATSVLMIGVTAVPGAIGHYVDNYLTMPGLEASAVLGVLAGSRLGFWVGARSRVLYLKLLMAVILTSVGVFYLFFR